MSKCNDQKPKSTRGKPSGGMFLLISNDLQKKPLQHRDVHVLELSVFLPKISFAVGSSYALLVSVFWTCVATKKIVNKFNTTQQKHLYKTQQTQQNSPMARRETTAGIIVNMGDPSHGMQQSGRRSLYTLY